MLVGAVDLARPLGVLVVEAMVHQVTILEELSFHQLQVNLIQVVAVVVVVMDMGVEQALLVVQAS
jgi:hypothetical protein